MPIMRKKTEIYICKSCSVSAASDKLPFLFIHDLSFLIKWVFLNRVIKRMCSTESISDENVVCKAPDRCPYGYHARWEFAKATILCEKLVKK